jgi:Histidine kinase-, DNA gyrase B-, and HSP90-like ATPase
VLESGKARALDAAIRDEVYLIAREAIRNAYRHAAAAHIEAEVIYGPAVFSLHVRDDGVGIEPDVIASGGRAGHWGLTGTRERATGFGGHREIWSRPGAGTEVALTVPAASAYVTFLCALIDAPDWLLDLYRSNRCRGITELYELRKLHEASPESRCARRASCADTGSDRKTPSAR